MSNVHSSSRRNFDSNSFNDGPVGADTNFGGGQHFLDGEDATYFGKFGSSNRPDSDGRDSSRSFDVGARDAAAAVDKFNYPEESSYVKNPQDFHSDSTNPSNADAPVNF